MERQERVSLRRFAQYALATGAQRRVMVADHRETVGTEWSPITDPYRFLIQAVVRMHETGGGTSALDDAIDRERTERRRGVIRDAAGDYVAWLDQAGTVSYFPVVATTWVCRNACVRVNPELGLVIDGQKYAVKLHMVKQRVTAAEAGMMTSVMRAALDGSVPSDCRMAVLDVRTGVLHIESPGNAWAIAQIEDAAEDLATRWERAS